MQYILHKTTWRWCILETAIWYIVNHQSLLRVGTGHWIQYSVKWICVKIVYVKEKDNKRTYCQFIMKICIPTYSLGKCNACRPD